LKKVIRALAALANKSKRSLQTNNQRLLLQRLLFRAWDLQQYTATMASRTKFITIDPNGDTLIKLTEI
jgi:hypothetical protein